MSAAADSIGSGDLNSLVDASMQMSEAKLSMGVAGALASTDQAMNASLLDILA